MFGARRYWCATASLLASVVFAIPALGSDLPTTVIVSSNISDARLTRALVLIRGELSALGLDVQVHGLVDSDAPEAASESTSQRLNLDVKDGVIVVRVFAAGAETPLVESVDLDGPDVTAEVIAVRAFEALRAARLLPPDSSRAVAPKPPAEHPPAEHPPEEHPPRAESQRPVPLLQLSFGPTFIQNSQGLPQLSAQAAVLVGPSWGFVALGFEGSLTTLDFERAAGTAEVSRRRLFLQLGARTRLHRAWELSARGGLSYLHYGANGVAEPGYEARDLEHSTGGASLSFGSAYYFVRAFGVYLDLSVLIAFDAAHVQLADESVVTLDRPSLALGCGLVLAAF